MKSVLIFIALMAAAVYGNPFPRNCLTENKLQYYYFPTLEGQTEILFNDTESLNAANLKPNTKTLFVIDGFNAHGITVMHIEMIRALAGRDDINVIAVDWQAYSGYEYPLDTPEQLAVAYASVTFIGVPLAGRDLANFIEFVQSNSNISYENVVVMGGSLGCHVAGATGKAARLIHNQTIGRIIGLDPSLQFSFVDAPVRLGVGDADVVEIYNTNRAGLGDMYPATGDVSIYVNGGNKQPCDNSPICHPHTYSYKLYGYLARNSSIKACPCNGAACLREGRGWDCREDGISVGPYIPESARGSYYVKTGYLDWS